MKSRNKKRLLALVLCMVVAISNSSFIFASETGQTEYPQEAEVQTQDEAVADDMDVAAYAADEGQAVADEQPAAVEQVAAEPETTAETQEAQPVAEAPAAEQPTTEAPAAQASAAQEPATVSEGTTTTSENTNAAVGEAQTSQGEENGETVTYNQEMNLKQDFTDEQGSVVATVSAEIPEGAFQVEESSQITMEVTTLTDTEKTQLENLMKEKIPAEKELSQYVAYNIRFKVDGTETESLQPIKITMTGDKTQIDDVENATVFYLDPADPTVPGDKDELEEIIQRTALIKSLQEAGQSIDNIDEDYDLSDITLGADGAAEKIQLEGRTSAIYGCYVENTPEEIIDEEEPTGDDRLNSVTLATEATEGQLTLQEDNGKLVASYTTSNPEEYGYVWYRSINRGKFEAQEPTTYTGIGSDIKEDGSELYIALNGGALGYSKNGVKNNTVQYKVKVFRKTDIKNNGLPIEGKESVAESTAYSVTSYYELQNGSFETPDVPYTSAINYQFSNTYYKEHNGVWQTTGRKNGQDIEIVNARIGSGFESSYSWHGSDRAQEGVQFAELNCEAAGALYQDVLTTPGETLNYQLYHRARGTSNQITENDTMYVLIMSTEMAISNNVTTQSKVMDVINHPNQYSGAMVVSYTDNDQKWYSHIGTYKVPNNSQQYSTRMFFVSGQTAAPANEFGEYTVGNFLDDIKLTREKLTPADRSATITVTKTISGLKYSEANALAQRLQFKVGTHEVTSNDVRYTWTGDADSYGEYTGSYVLTIPESELGRSLQVEEKVASGSSLDVDGYTRTTSVSVNGAAATNGTTSTITVSSKDTATVEFENVYVMSGGGGGGSTTPEEPETSVLHEKYIKRNDDGTYDITLNVSGTIGTETKKANLDVVLVVDTSGSMGDIASGQNKTRLAITKDAIDGLVTTFNNEKTVDVRYKLVGFSDTASLLTSNWVTGDDLKARVSTLNANGGTNYDKGLSVGASAIDTSTSEEGRLNPQKIVIFLTDGEPTLYGDGYGGGSYTNVDTYNSAKEAASKINCDKFYAVGIGLPANIKIYSYVGLFYSKVYKELTGLQLLNEIVGCATASTKEADNLESAAALGSKFQNLAGEILQYACKEVVISDTLSDYVKTTSQSRLVVKEAVKEDDKFKELKNHEVALSSTEEQVALDEGVSAIASYNSTTKTATLTFPVNYELKKDHYYYLTITNVKPSEKAFYEYQTNGIYPATGDPMTDSSQDGYKAVGEGTSSEKSGFNSNKSAKVTYKYKEKKHEEIYANPVIQVDTDTDTVSHTVNKTWSDSLTPVPVIVKLVAYVTEAADSNVTDDTPKDLTVTDMKNLPTNMQVELSNENGWTYTWKNLPTNYYYKVGETIKQTVIHYSVEEVQTESTKEFYGQVTESPDGTITSILNKKKDEEDKPFIEVTKTFDGLTKTQIKKLAEADTPYTITVTKDGTNPVESFTLTMDKDNLNTYLIGSEESKTWTYTWRLENCSEGTYSVLESAYDKTGYDVSVTVNGSSIENWNNVKVEPKESDIKSYAKVISETKCSARTFDVGDVNLIVAKLTEGYFVWTRNRININERLAIVNLINTKAYIGFSPEANLDNCNFYSGNGIESTLVFRDGEIKYADGKIQFDASKQWSMFAAGKYEFADTQNAEIAITNTYTEQTADLDLVKTSVNGTPFDGAEFKLYKKNVDGNYEVQRFQFTDQSGEQKTRETIQVANTGSEAELKNLQSGQYYLEEVKAPATCMLLADKIYFKQEKGVITLTDNSGTPLSASPKMWALEGTTNKYVLTVKNEIIYDLPSTGHTGIFNILMSGILLMFAGILIIYKMKGKEVLKK